MRVLLIAMLLSCLLISGAGYAQDTTATPTTTPTPSLNLRIWFPDVLALSGERSINALLVEQSQTFAETRPDVNIEYRLKAASSVGGIMSSLRNARNVAPAALPSITLMRRQDLVSAQRDGLIQSLEGGVASSIQADLNNVLSLGQVNGTLYGLPYMLELQSIVYRPQEGVDYSDWSYAGVLERNVPYIFAAGRTSGISDVLYLQYMNSGGSLNADGSLQFDAEALETSLVFYEAASDAGILNGFSLNYNNSAAYLQEFQSGNYEMAVFNSTSYLQLYGEDDSLAIAPIPSETGEALTILNGWLWVVVTENPEERALALDYIAWMMDSARQNAAAQAIVMLPSRQSALMLGLANGADVAPYLALLENPILPLSDGEAASLGAVLQSALASVLTLESTATEATERVISLQNP